MQQPGYFTFGIQSEMPSPIDVQTISARSDEANAIMDLLSETQTRTILITGVPGVGKSTLAALIFGQLQSQPLEGLPGFRFYIWLRPGPRSSWPDIVNALFNALQFPGKLHPQFSQRFDLQLLYDALRRPGQGALVVLDQAEGLFSRALETQNQSSAYTVGVDLSNAVRFLEMLQQDLGDSRFIVTCARSPYGSDHHESPHVREHTLGGLTIVEGLHLLQQRNVTGLQQDLSTVWQRCSGHPYTLVLFSTLKSLSGLSLHYLLNSPTYQSLWSGDVTYNLLEAVVSFLNPLQMSLVRALCLFRELVPLAGAIEVVTGEQTQVEADLKVYEPEMKSLTLLGLVEQVMRYDGEVGYCLREVPNDYLLSHYLESELHKASNYATSSLGVANQPAPLQANVEARKVALAAGHMRVVSYYQRQAQKYPSRQQRSGPNDIVPLLAMLEHLCLGWREQESYDQFCALGLDEDLVRWENWHTLAKLYEMMLSSTGSLKRRDEGLVCSALGMIYSRLGEYEQSRTYYTSALAIQQDMGDHQSQAITLINQGEFLRTLGDRGLARQNFEQARALIQPAQSPELACILMHNMALLAQQDGDFQQSQTYFMQSLQIVRQLQDRRREGMILTNLGLMLCQQERYQDGLALLLPALQIRHAQSDPSVDSLIAFLNKIEQRMGNATFTNLRQTAQSNGKQEQVLRMLAAAI